jgi:hypothetical protein
MESIHYSSVQLILDWNDEHFPNLFVADDAFPLSVNIMKPYPGIFEQLSERFFNYCLSQAGRIVENNFVLLASVYSVFR